ncbi:hypothetical protein GCM10011583_68300 [Streptomyces camponoticapitis]|uniref:Small hydrophobic protein n=1 Tax=Streptomyces camponoticapitis TaxID=1616125 RepID=A0ABQ2EVD7_9ACTN|nr:DUF6126 family protein [Streptomyces camponoticapitis]GGK26613.1 hypothetical protein GCM10011583_68300 [Streptomyces camponoticapitis]
MSDNPVDAVQNPSPEEPAKSVMDEERNFPRGLAIRLFAYLVAGHVLAGFLYLLFEAGAGGR